MYRKGPGPSDLSSLDENPDYTCPDKAELPVLQVLIIQPLRQRLSSFTDLSKTCD